MVKVITCGGRQYRLEVIEQNGKHRIETKGKNKLRLYVQQEPQSKTGCWYLIVGMENS